MYLDRKQICETGHTCSNEEFEEPHFLSVERSEVQAKDAGEKAKHRVPPRLDISIVDCEM